MQHTGAPDEIEATSPQWRTHHVRLKEMQIGHPAAACHQPYRLSHIETDDVGAQSRETGSKPPAATSRIQYPALRDRARAHIKSVQRRFELGIGVSTVKGLPLEFAAPTTLPLAFETSGGGFAAR
jgi:hypothetical protein